MKQKLNIKTFFHENYKGFVDFAETYVLERAVAEDIVQDIFVYYHEKKADLDIHTNLKSYFISSIKNKCLNTLRDKRIHDHHNILYLEAILNMETVDHLDDKDLEDIIQKAIEALPSEMSKVFKLRFLYGKNYSEVAEILNITKNTVKTHLSRGKKKLKDTLSKQLHSINLFSFLFF